MVTVLLSCLVMLVIVTIMAVGVIAGRKPISGSCGGMSAVGINSECDICGGNPAKCETQSQSSDNKSTNSADLAYDASKQPSRDTKQS